MKWRIAGSILKDVEFDLFTGISVAFTVFLILSAANWLLYLQNRYIRFFGLWTVSFQAAVFITGIGLLPGIENNPVLLLFALFLCIHLIFLALSLRRLFRFPRAISSVWLSVPGIVLILHSIWSLMDPRPGLLFITACTELTVLYFSFSAAVFHRNLKQPDMFYDPRHLVLLSLSLLLPALAGGMALFGILSIGRGYSPGISFFSSPGPAVSFLIFVLSLIVLNMLFQLFILGKSREETANYESGLLLYQGEGMYTGLMAAVNRVILNQSAAFYDDLQGLEETGEVPVISRELSEGLHGRIIEIQKLIHSRNLLLDSPVMHGDIIDLFSFLLHANALLRVYPDTGRVSLHPLEHNSTLKLPFKYVFTMVMLTAQYLQKYSDPAEDSLKLGLSIEQSGPGMQKLTLRENSGYLNVPDWNEVLKNVRSGISGRSGRIEFAYWLNFYAQNHHEGEITYHRIEGQSVLECTYSFRGVQV